MARTSCFMLKTTPRTLVSNVAAKLFAVWAVIKPRSPSVAALFTATSSRPNRATVLSTKARTSSSLRTSALMNSASAPRDCSSLASAWPASLRRPEMTTVEPFFAKATAAARPMPVSAPVIKTTCVLILRSLAEPRETWWRFDGAELFIPLRGQKAQNGMKPIPLLYFEFFGPVDPFGFSWPVGVSLRKPRS